MLTKLLSSDQRHLTLFTWLHFDPHDTNREKNSLVWALTAMDLLGFQICTGYKRSKMLMIDNKLYSTSYIPQSNKGSVNALEEVKENSIIALVREMSAKVKFPLSCSRPQ